MKTEKTESASPEKHDSSHRRMMTFPLGQKLKVPPAEPNSVETSVLKFFLRI